MKVSWKKLSFTNYHGDDWETLWKPLINWRYHTVWRKSLNHYHIEIFWKWRDKKNIVLQDVLRDVLNVNCFKSKRKCNDNCHPDVRIAKIQIIIFQSKEISKYCMWCYWNYCGWWCYRTYWGWWCHGINWDWWWYLLQMVMLRHLEIVVLELMIQSLMD